MMQVCTQCKTAKDLQEFLPDKKRKSGRGSWCRICFNKYRREKRAQGKYKDPFRHLSNYQMTLDDYVEIMADQKFGCAICGMGPIAPNLSLSVDHDHSCCSAKAQSCGQCVRGLLCGKCNLLIGYANDDPALLQSAIEYLNKPPLILPSFRRGNL